MHLNCEGQKIFRSVTGKRGKKSKMEIRGGTQIHGASAVVDEHQPDQHPQGPLNST